MIMNKIIKPTLVVLIFVSATCLFACEQTQKKNEKNDVAVTSSKSKLPDGKNFQATIRGKQTALYVLKNKNGAQAAFTNFGGRLVSLLVPDQRGVMTDVVVGFDSLATYQAAADFYGASIGRYGNRIGHAKFSLDGKLFSLPANNGPNTLHGGKEGFDSKVWDAKQPDEHTLEISYLSADGEQGFPGNLKVKVIYELLENNSLRMAYSASTDKKTVVNLTNHTYWNLNGCGSGTILNHMLQIEADAYTPVDTTLIPTGKLASVAGTPFDFRKSVTIGVRIEQADEQLKNGKGYDHNFVLNKHEIPKPVAAITGDKSGITMQIYTSEPGIQFYSGNFMKGKSTVKGGAKNYYRTGFCLETQHYPDSPNQPTFPSTVLKPGQIYQTITTYKFTVKGQKFASNKLSGQFSPKKACYIPKSRILANR
ncbi:MAG: galactose mutarotase [Mucilaginibacter sp.]|nr:galactose mutarotase [Mucilaginibacter sp.]